MGDKEKKNPHGDRDRSASGFRKTGIIVIISFLLLFVIVILIDTSVFPLSPSEKNNQQITMLNALWSGAYTLLMNVAAAGVTIGAGTVLYAHFDFVQYVKSVLCKVILEYHFVDRLNDREKEKLMRRLQKYLIYHDTESSNDTLYDFVNEEVRTLTQGPYYEKMSAHVYCKLENGKLVKHIVRQMTINCQQQTDFQFDLEKLTRCYFYGDADKAKENTPFEMNKLTINGEPMSGKIECTCEATKDDRGYGCVIGYRFKQGVEGVRPDKDHILKIVMEYTTKVDKSDKTLCFRTYFPCKALKATFVHERSLNVNPDVFCFKDRKTDGSLDRERVQILQLENCITIDFQGWLLPGDGIIYYIEEAEKTAAIKTGEEVKTVKKAEVGDNLYAAST